jgi:CRP/FNR family transcriptional regulator, cyclic AMP receptor protein
LPQILEPLLRDHKFFAGLPAEYLALLVGCASEAVFPEGALLFREGKPADTFFLLREGRVALEIAAPGHGALLVQTLGEGDVAGFSWLVEPHQWEFDGRAVAEVRAVRMNGTFLRAKCAEDPRLGYELMRRFAHLATVRLQATRLQLLDVYGHARGH